MGAQGEITRLLVEFGQGEPDAMDRLLPLVYDELHKLARSHRVRWRDMRLAPGTTSIVHEAYLKLVDQTHVDWKDRAQFFYIASRAMRTILIDNARRHRARKRGGDRRQVPLEGGLLASEERHADLLALDQALTDLEEEDERLARIVECRFFGGLTIAETAEALSVSPATVKRGWKLARTWLYKRLRVEPP